MNWRAGLIGLGLGLALSAAALAGETENEHQQEQDAWLPRNQNQTEQPGSQLYEWEIKEVWQVGIDCQRRGDNRDAIALYERCREADPLRIEVLPYLGLALDSEGRAAEAVLRYQEYLAQEPDDLVVRFNCAVACYHAGDYAQALSLAEPIHQDDYEFEELFSLLGVCYLEQHNLFRALPCLLKAQSLKPQCSRVYSNLVSAYVELGDLAAAKKYAVRALELAPHAGAALNNAGVVLEADGKVGLAQLAFKEAGQRGVAQAQVNGLLLQSARGEADILQAAECADEHPKLSQARLIYAWMLMRDGRAEEARRELEGWHKEHAPQPESLMCLGAVYYRLGDYAQALEHYRQSAEMRPTAEAHYNASLCLSKLKRDEEAKQERQTARDLEKQQREVAQVALGASELQAANQSQDAAGLREKDQRAGAPSAEKKPRGKQDPGNSGNLGAETSTGASNAPGVSVCRVAGETAGLEGNPGTGSETVGSETAASATALSPRDNALHFVVTMPQQPVDTLVSGEITVNGEKFKAASGKVGEQMYGDYWRPLKSSCPPNEAAGTSYYLDLCWTDSSYIGGPFYHMFPDPICAKDGQGRRTEIGIHEDLGAPGTGGCIGVDSADWPRLRQALDRLSLYNYRLPLTVEYVRGE